MFRLLFGYVLVFVISFCLYSTANAETLILQSGQKITGKIIERTDLRITVDVQGVPQTYFLGEIASIDGTKVGALQGNNAVTPQIKENNSNAPHHNRRAKARRGTGAPSSSPDLVRIESLVSNLRLMMDKMANMNKTVVPTPDGGIIVVNPQRIIKYDKNLNVVKEIDLQTVNTAKTK